MATLERTSDRTARRIPRWAVLGGAVLVLAAAVTAGAALSSPGGAPGPAPSGVAAVVSDPVDETLDRAEAALASGDTTGAAELAERVLAANPGNARAGSVRDRARPRSATPTSGQSQPTTPGVFAGPLPIRSLMPVDVDGYELGFAVVSESDGDVSAEPRPGTPQAAIMTRVLLSVHDRGSVAEADAYIGKVTKKLYAKDVSSAEIAGAPAYVATDGSRLAAVVFVRGRYVFEAIGTARDVPPAEVREHVIRIAGSFPTAP